MIAAAKPLLRVLGGERLLPPPIWLMRQAGRYLPEYRETRAQAQDFLTLCFTPALAEEVTLQPIRRFGFDGAILFSDILVVPLGLGQTVWFEEGIGPRLKPITEANGIARLTVAALPERLAPVYEAVTRLAKSLPPETTLIGFAGAPWTVASYMIEGGSSKDFATAKAWAYRAPDTFAQLIDLLIEATTEHLLQQIAAGAEAVQLFDSWAGVWPEDALRRWCLAPAMEIRRRVKAAHPQVPFILFPRGVGILTETFARESGAEAIGIDTTVPLGWARDTLQPHAVLQGNLDPALLVAGGEAMERQANQIVETLGQQPFIFNLGHGVMPSTPVEHVARLVETVRTRSGKG